MCGKSTVNECTTRHNHNNYTKTSVCTQHTNETGIQEKAKDWSKNNALYWNILDKGLKTRCADCAKQTCTSFSMGQPASWSLRVTYLDTDLFGRIIFIIKVHRHLGDILACITYACHTATDTSTRVGLHNAHLKNARDPGKIWEFRWMQTPKEMALSSLHRFIYQSIVPGKNIWLGTCMRTHCRKKLTLSVVGSLPSISTIVLIHQSQRDHRIQNPYMECSQILPSSSDNNYLKHASCRLTFDISISISAPSAFNLKNTQICQDKAWWNQPCNEGTNSSRNTKTWQSQ